MSSLGATNDHAPPPQRVVLITGGASGIGHAMARHFASAGSRVFILDVDAATGPGVAAEIAASTAPPAAVEFRTCDVTSWPAQAAVFKDVFDAHGRIDVVMANAGVSEQAGGMGRAAGRETLEEPSMRTWNVNFVGVVYSIKLAVYYMQKNVVEPDAPLKGSIVCTASNSGIYSLPIAPIYSASKAAIINLVRSMGRSLGQEKIQINALAPSVIQTNIVPSSLFEAMVPTHMSALIRGVQQFLDDPARQGQVAEIHGDSVTIRAPAEYVDEDTEKNYEVFWAFGHS